MSNFDFHALVKNAEKIKRIFFYRICGAGMGPAACLLKEKGFVVEGGDMNFYPPMSTYLQTTGIHCHELKNITPDFLKTFDLIVVGNVVAGNSDTSRMIESLGVPYASFPATLGALVLRDCNVVGIAGTHGKTTTTYLATQIFEKLGMNPGYLIGGVLDDRPPSHLGTKYFFIEADEYDSAYFEKISKFRLYSIDHLILTSLEFDHADIFSCMEDIENQFRAAIPQITKSFLISADYSSSLKIFNEYKESYAEARWNLFGLKSPVGPKDIVCKAEGSSFVLELDNKYETFETNLVGIQNVLNLSACLLFAFHEGFAVSTLKQVIQNLKMVRRRQEIRGNYKGALVIDDFAHHPRAVELTIDSIRHRYPDKKLVVVFEPRSATARSSVFQKEFAESFKGIEALIVAQNQLPVSVKGAQSLDFQKLAQDVANFFNISTHVVDSLSELNQQIDRYANAETVLLILSNGTCLGLWETNFPS